VTRKPGPTVFVVDDEPHIGTSLVAILALQGYRATAFTSPLKALEAARFRTPDIIISDVDMPELTGIDLAILMATHFPSVQILLFSGQDKAATLLQIAQRKGHHFRLLQKPVHPAVMLEEVGKMSLDDQLLTFTA
jgi:two-component system C4-dicarboxylate transport response regulator DctD